MPGPNGENIFLDLFENFRSETFAKKIDSVTFSKINFLPLKLPQGTKFKNFCAKSLQST